MPVKYEPVGAEGTKAKSFAENLRIGMIVASYFIISISLVFSNKVLITPDVSIPAPMFVIWFQCVVTAAICYGLGQAGIGAKEGSFLAQFPKQEYDLEVAKKVMLLSGCFIGMIGANQLCLKYVEVSFYNVARSLTIVCNVILSYLILGQKTNQKTLAALCVVIFGFYVGANGEVNFSLIGTLFGVGSSIMVSLNSICTRYVMPVVGNNKWKLAFYNNMNASFLFIPVMWIFGEFDIIAQHSEMLQSPRFWGLMIFAGLLGFAIGIVVVMQINATSPLTHNLAGTAKACVQTILALMIWQNPTTVRAMGGVACVLAGSLLYAYIRIKTNEAEALKQAQAEEPKDLEMQPTKDPVEASKA